MKIQLFLVMILSTFSLVSCETEKQVLNTNADMKDLTIKYGTSFGMCVGACKRELTFTNDEVAYTLYYNEGRGATGEAPKTYTEKVTADFSSELAKSVDFETFKKLEERIGCPDCADGGAEWIEITKNDSRHKVTFENGADIKELAALLKLLRPKKQYFDEKYVNKI